MRRFCDSTASATSVQAWSRKLLTWLRLGTESLMLWFWHIPSLSRGTALCYLTFLDPFRALCLSFLPYLLSHLLSHFTSAENRTDVTLPLPVRLQVTAVTECGNLGCKMATIVYSVLFSPTSQSSEEQKWGGIKGTAVAIWSMIYFIKSTSPMTGSMRGGGRGG